MLRVERRVRDDVGSSGQELQDTGQKFLIGMSLNVESHFFFFTTFLQVTSFAPSSMENVSTFSHFSFFFLHVPQQ